MKFERRRVLIRGATLFALCALVATYTDGALRQLASLSAIICVIVTVDNLLDGFLRARRKGRDARSDRRDQQTGQGS